MLKDIIKNSLFRCWNKYRWNNKKKWCDESRIHLLKEAEDFLIQNSLIKSKDDMEVLAEKWHVYVKKTFNPKQPDSFYSCWRGEIGASNIVANIKDQFSRPYILHALAEILDFYKNRDLTILDFGCGTAALSMAFQKTFVKNSRLFLADVENLPRQFIRFIKRNRKEIIELVSTDLKEIKDASIDIVLCIHVLEHIKNPAEVFKLIHSKVRNGGVILLEAPWGGEREHIKESPLNWKKRGGEIFLRENYVKMNTMNPLINWLGGISGVYKKIRD